MTGIEELSETMEQEDFDQIKISKEQLTEATKFSQNQLRAMVDMYYNLQKLRCGAANKKRAHDQQYDTLFDSILMDVMKDRLFEMELKTGKILETYVKSKPLGQWALSITGLGAITVASLMGHIDFSSCCCEQYDGIPRKKRPKHNCPGLMYGSNIHSFAGLNPNQVWEKGQRRPWNARLKTTCWQIGESFKKAFSVKKTKMDDKQLRIALYDAAKAKNKILTEDQLNEKMIKEKKRLAKKVESIKGEEWFYVRLYHNRLIYENANNEAGKYKREAEKRLALYKKVVKSAEDEKKYAEGKKILMSGKLTPKAIEERSKRYAVKFFLSHYFDVGKSLLTGEPIERAVKPWIIQHGGHSCYIPPPNFPMK
ncbi:hypothetical protein C4577_06555 [Candidatus Parcubacteria bacterium]|nr:MAG: hypothetical protein C4577_06555 [Candidatus Parcubacteria bacterium]